MVRRCGDEEQEKREREGGFRAESASVTVPSSWAINDNEQQQAR